MPITDSVIPSSRDVAQPSHVPSSTNVVINEEIDEADAVVVTLTDQVQQDEKTQALNVLQNEWLVAIQQREKVGFGQYQIMLTESEQIWQRDYFDQTVAAITAANYPLVQVLTGGNIFPLKEKHTIELQEKNLEEQYLALELALLNTSLAVVMAHEEKAYVDQVVQVYRRSDGIKNEKIIDAHERSWIQNKQDRINFFTLQIASNKKQLEELPANSSPSKIHALQDSIIQDGMAIMTIQNNHADNMQKHLAKSKDYCDAQREVKVFNEFYAKYRAILASCWQNGLLRYDAQIQSHRTLLAHYAKNPSVQLTAKPKVYLLQAEKIYEGTEEKRNAKVIRPAELFMHYLQLELEVVLNAKATEFESELKNEHDRLAKQRGIDPAFIQERYKHYVLKEHNDRIRQLKEKILSSKAIKNFIKSIRDKSPYQLDAAHFITLRLALRRDIKVLGSLLEKAIAAKNKSIENHAKNIEKLRMQHDVFADCTCTPCGDEKRDAWPASEVDRHLKAIRTSGVDQTCLDDIRNNHNQTFMHFALVAHRLAIFEEKRSKKEGGAVQTKASQKLEDLKNIIQYLNRHGNSFYVQDEKGLNPLKFAQMISEEGYEVKVEVQRDQEEKHSESVDWDSMTVMLETIPARTTFEARIKQALLDYSKQAKKLTTLGDYTIVRFWYNWTVKTINRLDEVGFLTHTLYDANIEITDMILEYEIKRLIKGAKRGYWGNSKLYEALEKIIAEKNAGKVVAFAAPVDLILKQKSDIDKQRRDTENAVLKEQASLDAQILAQTKAQLSESEREKAELRRIIEEMKAEKQPVAPTLLSSDVATNREHKHDAPRDTGHVQKGGSNSVSDYTSQTSSFRSLFLMEDQQRRLEDSNVTLSTSMPNQPKKGVLSQENASIIRDQVSANEQQEAVVKADTTVCRR